ncbi:MAG: DHH family phosphoesterase [Candidatus Cloacimonetes bacterium]|nr:DHH family phosphoesterase [Candidatus Cloacimonadota bacterium]
MKPSSQEELKSALVQLFSEDREIAILTHKNPDGDGLASALALQQLFSDRFAGIHIILEEPAPKNYDFLDVRKRTSVYDPHQSFPHIVMLDCHEVKRLGRCALLVPGAEKVIAIDHHIAGEIIPGACTYLDPDAVSVGFILYSIFRDEIWSRESGIRRYLATCCYVSIINDTDNFQNLNLNTATFQTCTELVSMGINPGRISQNFFARSIREIRYAGDILSSMEIRAEGRILLLYSSLDLVDRHGVTMAANSKFTRWVKGARGVEVVIFLQQVDNDLYRISLRSQMIDVREIAARFGGGGHSRAAGFESNESMDNIKEKLFREIEKRLP